MRNDNSCDLSDGEGLAIREQVRLFLQDKSIDFEGSAADFRKKCLAELNLARKTDLLTAENLSRDEVARHAANFQQHADPKGMVDGAEQVIGQIAGDLASKYPNLAKLLTQRPPGSPPLLVSVCDSDDAWRVGDFLNDGELGFNFNVRPSEKSSQWADKAERPKTEGVGMIPLVCSKCFHSIFFSKELLHGH